MGQIDRIQVWLCGESKLVITAILPILIAKRAGITVSDILTVHPEICNPNLIVAGQVLALPPRD